MEWNEKAYGALRHPFADAVASATLDAGDQSSDIDDAVEHLARGLRRGHGSGLGGRHGGCAHSGVASRALRPHRISITAHGRRWCVSRNRGIVW